VDEFLEKRHVFPYFHEIEVKDLANVIDNEND